MVWNIFHEWVLFVLVLKQDLINLRLALNWFSCLHLHLSSGITGWHHLIYIPPAHPVYVLKFIRGWLSRLPVLVLCPSDVAAWGSLFSYSDQYYLYSTLLVCLRALRLGCSVAYIFVVVVFPVFLYVWTNRISGKLVLGRVCVMEVWGRISSSAA